MEAFSLEGKNIAITGAAGHLGSELSLFLSQAGAHLYLIDRDSPGLEVLADKLSNETKASVASFSADLEDQNSRGQLVQELKEKCIALDGLIHGAAFVGTSDLTGWGVQFKDQSVETWRRAIEVNVTAPFHLTQLMLPLFETSRAPSVVMIGSVHGMVGPDWGLYEGLTMASPAAYSASKAALLQLSRWLATSLAPNIRVNSVSPGGIERGQPADFVSRYESRTPMKRMGSVQDILGAVAFLLSDAAQYVTGQNIVVDGGYTAW